MLFSLIGITLYSSVYVPKAHNRWFTDRAHTPEYVASLMAGVSQRAADAVKKLAANP
jgi:hypothetical protein